MKIFKQSNERLPIIVISGCIDIIEPSTIKSDYILKKPFKIERLFDILFKSFSQLKRREDDEMEIQGEGTMLNRICDETGIGYYFSLPSNKLN